MNNKHTAIKLDSPGDEHGYLLTNDIFAEPFEIVIAAAELDWELKFRLFERSSPREYNLQPSRPSRINIRLGRKQISEDIDKLVLMKVKAANTPELMMSIEVPRNRETRIYMQPLAGTERLAIRVSDGQELERVLTTSLHASTNEIYVSKVKSSDNVVLSAQLTLFSQEEMDSSISPFRVGSMIFRYGDMFNLYPLNNCRLILLPAATNGQINHNIANRAAEMGIPLARKRPAGTISTFKLDDGSGMSAGYAYSVENDSSDEKIISNICFRILELCSAEQGIVGINIPLFGTGAGKLSAAKVAAIYDSVFNGSEVPMMAIVSIGNEAYFKSVKKLFSGSYVPVILEKQEDKPDLITMLESQLGQTLNASDFEVSTNGEVTGLNLSNSIIADGSLLIPFVHLTSLNLNGQLLKDYSFLKHFKKLDSLYLAGCDFVDLMFLREMDTLRSLDLSGNNQRNFVDIRGLRGMKFLYLANNRIIDTTFLGQLRDLEYLDLSDNDIADIRAVSELKALKTLNLRNNRIRDISPLKKMGKLVILNISGNLIGDAEVITRLKNLRFLSADNNPLVKRYELNLDESDTHHFTLMNYFSRRAESDLKTLALPAKVLILGNHGSGKSSLLSYLIKDRFDQEIESTHIIRIEKFYLDNAIIPEAIFFDFGGQDFYHGIYRTFLTGGAVYLVLWDPERNVNRQGKDRNGLFNQDFALSYWFGQKKFLEDEVFDGSRDPVLLIQSHRDSFGIQNHGCLFGAGTVVDEFHLTMKNNAGRVNILGLEYLKGSVLELVSSLKVEKEEPQWYIDFVNFIVSRGSSDSYQSLDLERDILPHYRREIGNRLEYLKDDLGQLHAQGLVLYYKNAFPDRVWVNPMALVSHIHEFILTRAALEKKGMLTSNDFTNGSSAEIVDLLVAQKVIFRDEQEDGIIIPNFLPLAGTEGGDFDLFSFGLDKPVFTLRFEHFLPFGIINDIIHFFGNAYRARKFWRNQILFKFEDKAKVMFKLDFELLEIKVFCTFRDAKAAKEGQEVSAYLFYSLMSLYWNMDPLDYNSFILFRQRLLRVEDYVPGEDMYNRIINTERIYAVEECRPDDLLISVDGRRFASYREICAEKAPTMIKALIADEDGGLTGGTAIIPIFPFQPFTPNKLRRKRKVVVSYSKHDLELVNKFLGHIVPLVDEEIIENPWLCSELIAASEWDGEISRRFAEADIIFFMVSDHLMQVDYVKEFEIKNAIDRYNKDRSPKIIPVILSPYIWQRKGDYDLGRFSALPFKAVPVTSFPDQNEAWKFVAEAVKLMVKEDAEPTVDGGRMNAEMRRICERIMKCNSAYYK